MANNVFEVVIKGPASHEEVELAELCAALTKLHQAAKVVAKREAADVSMHLVDVYTGQSGHYTINGSPVGLGSLATITNAIQTTDFSDIPRTARTHLFGLQKIARRNKWTSFGIHDNGTGIGNALIMVEGDLIPKERVYRGLTTLYGFIRATGSFQLKKSKAKFELLNETKIIISLASRELSQELGEYIDRVVGLEGEAHWDIETDRLVRFMALRLGPYRDRDPGKRARRTINESVDHLAEAARGRWDDIDPTEFLKELRSE